MCGGVGDCVCVCDRGVKVVICLRPGTVWLLELLEYGGLCSELCMCIVHSGKIHWPVSE